MTELSTDARPRKAAHLLELLGHPVIQALLGVAVGFLVLGVVLLVISRFVDNDRWPTPRKDAIRDAGGICIAVAALAVGLVLRAHLRATP